MSDQRIRISDELYLSPTVEADMPFFLGYMNDPEIYRNTLRVPHPYTLADAEWFLHHCREKRQRFGRDMEFRIRLQSTGEPIGGVGLHGIYGPASHRDEIGYVLARSHWGKGIMTQAVKTFCAWAFANTELVRIEAPIFDFNIASQRVVEKAGFVKEGTFRKMYFKNGEYFDGIVYSLLK